jgi:hypothetical protein
MGLAERRAAERWKNDYYPDWKARIDQAAGFDVPIEVSWEQLAEDDYADSYAEFFPQVYFQPLVLALSAITVDDMGKNAIRDGLSKIVIKNSGEYGSTSGITFRNGVLTINHRPHVNVHYYEERAKAIQQNLESGI